MNCCKIKGVNSYQNLFDPTVLEEVERDLVHLGDALQNDKHDIQELQKSVRVVIETQDDPLARLTLYQVALWLTRARDARFGKEDAQTVIPLISVILQKLEKSYRQ